MAEKVTIASDDLGNLYDTIRLLLGDIRKEDMTANTARALGRAFDTALKIMDLQIPKELIEDIANYVDAEPGKPKLNANDMRKLVDTVALLVQSVDFMGLRREDKMLLVEGLGLVTKVSPPLAVPNGSLQQKIKSMLSSLSQDQRPGEAV